MQTIGERLEDARKRKGISIREAAEATKIRGDYLQKFEGNQFDLDLAPIYMRGFLRNYANFLKIPADRILDDYDALGRGDARPRPPSREVYGRMDLSIASPEDRADHAAAGAAASAGDAASRPGPQLRGHSPLPKGPPIDPALVFKGGIVVVCLVAFVLIFWISKSLFVGAGAPAAEARGTQMAAPLAEPSLTLVGLDTVHVTVSLADGSRVLLPETTLERDQRMVVSRPGPVLIQADVGANVQFEVNGRRYAMPQGSNRVKLQ